MQLQRYRDLLASVRHDGNFHSIMGLVQPDDLEVRNIAKVLLESPTFVADCQEFVNSFTTYRREIGDYWAKPGEILYVRSGDCDDKAILLVSLLRNKIPAEKVFCAFGYWSVNGKKDGHMWVVMEGDGVTDRIIEATAGPDDKITGYYTVEAIFNDVYAFAYPSGITNFNLLTVACEKTPAS